MNLAALKAFVAAAHSQSFSRAAEALFLTQPGLSKRIVGLENALNTKLFERLGSGVVLTEAGQTFLPYAERVCDTLNDAKSALLNLEAEVNGRLRFGTTQHIALYHLQEVLEHFMQSFPEVDMNVAFIDSQQAEQLLLDDTLELAYITQPLEKNPNIEYRRVSHERLCFVVNKAHPLAQRGAVQLNDLSKYRAIVPAESAFTRQYLDKLFQEQGVTLNAWTPSDFLEIMRLFAATGAGWSVLPENMLDERFAILPLARFEISRPLVMAWRKHQPLSLPAEVFLQRCRIHSPLDDPQADLR